MFCHLLALLLLTALALPAQGQGRHYLRTEYLYSMATCLAEHADGTMWIGTPGGLFRYNGYYYNFYYSDTISSSLVSNYINSIYVDPSGRAWIATNGGVCAFNNELGFIREAEAGQGYHPVYAIAEADSNHLFISTHDGLALLDKTTLTRSNALHDLARNRSEVILSPQGSGHLWMVNRYTGHIEVYALPDFRHLSTYPLSSKAQCMTESPDGFVWVGCSAGLACLSATDGQPQVLSPSLAKLVEGHSVYLLQYRNGVLHLGLNGLGMWQYDVSTTTLTPSNYTLDTQSAFHSGLIDHSGGAWLILSRRYGLRYYSAKPSPFTTPEPLQSFVHHHSIRTLLQDHEGNVWFNLDHHRLARYSPSTGQVTPFTFDRHGIGFANHVARNGHLYVAEWDIHEYAPTPSGGLRYLRTIPQQRRPLSILETGEGQVWFIRSDSLVCISPSGQISRLAAPEGVEFYNGYYSPHSQRIFLLSLDQGVYELTTPENPDSAPRLHLLVALSRHGITNLKHLLEDDQGLLWLGTLSDGLYCYYPQNDSLAHYTIRSGLAGASVQHLLQAPGGTLIVTTSAGLTLIDPATHRLMNYTQSADPLMNQYMTHSGFIDPEGYAYLGSNGGLIRFNPATLVAPASTAAFYIDEISINGIPVGSINPQGQLISHTLPAAQAGTTLPVRLTYRQNSLSFTFSEIDYDDDHAPQYAYRLEGYSPQWTPTTTHDVNFVHLAPGSYRFAVRAYNKQGQWCEPLTFAFIISPPVWLTPIAIVIYTFLALALILLTIVLILRWRMHEASLRFMENELLINERITEIKVNFFTNISHEFRTPLTLIVAPVRQLLEQGVGTAAASNLVHVIERNVQKMLRLTDRLLEFNSQKSVELALDPTPGDMATFIRETIHIFEYGAHYKDITFNYQGPDHLPCLYDAGKVNDILSNLLSNAIKYSYRHGLVTIALRVIATDRAVQSYPSLANPAASASFVEISVSDQGLGIPDARKEEVFNRYQRLPEAEAKMNATGFGIGLHYARQLVELHGGVIILRDNQPRGSVFSFVLPMLSAENAVPDATSLAESSGSNLPGPVDANHVANDNRAKYRQKVIIVVEDDIDLNHYLENSLSPLYHVLPVFNGQECLDLLQTTSADLILTDRMMPVMSGDTLCQRLKATDGPWALLPVILLTARADSASHIQGLHLGADAYLSKPFDLQHLIAQIDNLLRRREALQAHILQLTSNSLVKEENHTATPTDALPPRDREFLEQIYALIEQHLAEPDFNVNAILRELCISKTNFYNRIKNLTGQGPSNFLAAYRMNRAVEFIQSDKYTLSEIAEKVGFSSLPSFSRAFKDHYGTSPSHYKAQGAGLSPIAH